MTESLSNRPLEPAIVTWAVYSLDMWGHVPADCDPSYDCDCCKPCEACQSLSNDCEQCDGKAWYHDDNACECHEDCNDRHKIGTIQTRENDSDSLILQTLIDDGFLKADSFERVTIDDYSDGSFLDVNDRDGRRIFSLERVDDA